MQATLRTLGMIMLIGALVASISLPASAAKEEDQSRAVKLTRDPVSVLVVDKDGEPITENGLLIDSKTYVPIIDISEAFQFKVRWEAISHTVYIDGPEDDIAWNSLTNKMKVNGKDTKLTTLPKVIKGKTYVPIQLLHDVFLFDFTWEGKSRTVTLWLDPQTYNTE
ncbi:stalk domain-containing protein [Paenibacillus thiaminolyticus]|uniref:Copper amine oxidase N-terminal domain-containing protein n=1 Tax=Paenibacillus thiaminolyticus TaxID=49283 RepID=A0A3A3GJ36_PANTH|nr:stalk domain-containing protein [Paenibacillus thiaminolyticus]RJG23170.1 copper amine oxidase N-terminal domain-containing protein [Paenibacillus thiaminolyticus]